MTWCVSSLAPAASFEDILSHNYVRYLTISDDCLWICTDNGVIRYDKQTGVASVLSDSEGDLNYDVVSIAFNGDYIWLGTDGNGVVRYNESSGRYVYDSSNSTLHNQYNNSLKFDERGNLWVVSLLKICKFDGEGWTSYTERVWQIYSSGIFYALEIDEEETVWFGGFRFGSVKDGVITVIDNNPGTVSDMVFDAEGTVWTSTLAGLSRYAGEEKATYNTTNSGIPCNYLTSIEIGEDGTFWLASRRGLIKYDGEFSSVDVGDDSIYIQSIAMDGDVLWIGSKSKGVYKYSNGVIAKVEPVLSDSDYEESASVASMVANGKDTESPVYNLSGVKIVEPSKGVVLKRGRKYLNR